MANNVEIIIVHGGWHKPISYNKLTKSLEGHGFKVHIPALPTMSDQRPPTADLETDSAFIRDFVTKVSDAGIKTIVIMHSYGGQVGTNSLFGLGAKQRASEGKLGGVVELVYMTGFAMLEGTSMTGWVESQGHGDLLPLAFDFQDSGLVYSRDPKTLLVGTDLLPEDEMEAYIATFTTWASKSWSDPLTHCAWRDIPVTYIQTLNDMTILIDYQKKFCEQMRDAGTRVDEVALETGHCPNVTATDKVAEAVLAVAAKVGA